MRLFCKLIAVSLLMAATGAALRKAEIELALILFGVVLIVIKGGKGIDE